MEEWYESVGINLLYEFKKNVRDMWHLLLYKAVKEKKRFEVWIKREETIDDDGDEENEDDVDYDNDNDDDNYWGEVGIDLLFYISVQNREYVGYESVIDVCVVR